MSLPADTRALMEAQSHWLGLTIAPEHQPGVINYLELASRIAMGVMAHPLEPVDEPANVFIPVEPQL